MANNAFLPGLEGIASGEISWPNGTIKAALMRGYTFNSAHKFVSDITGAGGSLVSTFTLTSKTYTNGVFDAADGTFTAVPSGAACDAILLFQSSAPTGGADLAATAQRVIERIDTGSGLPMTPNGGDLPVTWSNGTDKIMRLYVP